MLQAAKDAKSHNANPLPPAYLTCTLFLPFLNEQPYLRRGGLVAGGWLLAVRAWSRLLYSYGMEEGWLMYLLPILLVATSIYIHILGQVIGGTYLGNLQEWEVGEVGSQCNASLRVEEVPSDFFPPRCPQVSQDHRSMAHDEP